MMTCTGLRWEVVSSLVVVDLSSVGYWRAILFWPVFSLRRRILVHLAHLEYDHSHLSSTNLLSFWAGIISAGTLVSVAFGWRSKVGTTLSTLISPRIFCFDRHFCDGSPCCDLFNFRSCNWFSTPECWAKQNKEQVKAWMNQIC